MARRDALFLRLTAAWTILIWAVFVKNQVGDETTSTGFKVVHLTLAVVSIALAVGVWRVASRSSRRERDRAGIPS
ncbi:MAG: hypothetical protein ACLGI2_17470 [Acidimicrobiia bacterium]